MKKIILASALTMLLMTSGQAYESFAVKDAHCKQLDQDYRKMAYMFGTNGAIQVVMNRINEFKYYCKDTNPAMLRGALDIYNKVKGK